MLCDNKLENVLCFEINTDVILYCITN